MVAEEVDGGEAELVLEGLLQLLVVHLGPGEGRGEGGRGVEGYNHRCRLKTIHFRVTAVIYCCRFHFRLANGSNRETPSACSRR